MFDKWFGHKDPFAKHADQQAQDGAYELVGTQRWVVLDTETTGLNIRHDRIISIAALAVHIEPDLSDAHIPWWTPLKR